MATNTAKTDDTADDADGATDDMDASAKSLLAFKLMLTMLAARPSMEHPAIVSAIMGTVALASSGMDDDAAMAFYDGPMRAAVRDSFDMVRSMGLIGDCDCQKCKDKRKRDGASSETQRSEEFNAILARMKQGVVH